MGKIITAYRKYRALEMVAGIVVWTTLILVVVLSFRQPLFMIYVAILFDLYWLLRVTYFLVYLSKAWFIYRRERQVDWMEKVESVDDWEKLHHVVFLPMVDEDVEVARHTLDAIIGGTYPSEKVLIVLAGEERMQEHFESVYDQVVSEYDGKFYDIVKTVHPSDLPGEIAGKGANLNWSGHRIQEYIDEKGWVYEDIIVTAFDIDTVADKQYFAYLSYTYLTHPNPTRSSYQPMALYNNNVWESPSFARVVANSTTFWLMAELSRPKPLWTFASHSMPWKAVVDVGFWQADVVSEDSRIFLQCYIQYDTEYEVTPMYVPVSMDTAYSGSIMGTVKNLYKQQRRWAWGIENFPFMIWHFWKTHLPRKKWKLVFNQGEGMFSWATAPILITVLGYLPLWAAEGVEKTTVVAQNAPFVLQGLMTLAMIGIIASALVNVYLLPHHEIPKGRKIWTVLIMMAQWILLPVVLVVFGSFAVIDAQTRMLLGKYLGFYTTKKTR